ncbi:MAG: DUF4142 domain-containing protein [Rudanella sp.]|nr:DUF4142 domain-containing protein [Rudanella sp.]
MKRTSFVAAGLFSILLSVSALAQTSTTITSPLMPPVQQSVTKLKALQATGDPDFDYVFRMRLLGQGVVDMAKIAAAQATDPAIKQKAQTFVDAKTKELAELEAMQRQMRPTRPNQAYTQQQSQQVQAMVLKMQPDGVPAKLTGKIDDDFTALMTEYIRDASDFSKAYLTYGNNASVKAIAQKMVAQ